MLGAFACDVVRRRAPKVLQTLIQMTLFMAVTNEFLRVLGVGAYQCLKGHANQHVLSSYREALRVTAGGVRCLQRPL